MVFINPGRSDETFWTTSGHAMQAAARSLGMRLGQQFAERDPERAIALVRTLAERPADRRPDYVVLVNEKTTLVQQARLLQAAGIKSFAAYSGLLPQEHESNAPREGLPLLLGSLEPQAEDAGYLTARALIQQGKARRLQASDGRLHLLAIAGDRSTPVSIARNQGMRRAVAEAGGAVVLDQVVFGDWKREQAQDLMAVRLLASPMPQLVWAGSDQMAFGAMTAARARGLRPGRQILFSAINTSAEAMQARIDGELTALAGGHFLCGAWAMVMLFDLHRGIDFRHEGLELRFPMFMLFERGDAQRFLERFGNGERMNLDFRPYSKVLNPELKQYRFALDGLLR